MKIRIKVSLLFLGVVGWLTMAAVSTDTTFLQNISSSGWLSLSGATNRLTVADAALKLDGVSVGGASVWTNSAGIVKPAGGQAATNRWQFVSGAADNATNVAVVIGSAVEWPSGGAVLSLTSSATNKNARIFPDGSLTLGRHTETIWGDTSFENATLLHLKDVLLGDSKNWEITLGATSEGDAFADVGKFSAYGTTNSFAAFIGTYDAGGNPDGVDIVGASGSGTDFRLYTAGAGEVFHVYPDGVTVVGAEKVRLESDGRITLAETTEPAAPDAGYVTLFATNNAGKMVLKVRFPTGVSQVIATEP